MLVTFESVSDAVQCAVAIQHVLARENDGWPDDRSMRLRVGVDLGDVIKRYKQVLVPELNMGQLLWLLRAKYLVDAIGLNKIQGRPFKQVELEQKIEEMLGVD